MTSPARVLAILNLFDEKHPVWHTDEINAAMGYTRATGYRYVKDLVEAGFLRKVSAGRYSLGPRIIELDYQVRRSDPVLRAAVPVMDDLVKKARLDAVLSMIYGTSLVDIYRASVDPTLQLSYGRGRPRPLFLGAAPKVILSQMARPQLVKIYESCAAEAAASGLGNTWPEFRSRLAAIRKEGFYWSHGELDRWLVGRSHAAVRCGGRCRGRARARGPQGVARRGRGAPAAVAPRARVRRDPGARQRARSAAGVPGRGARRIQERQRTAEAPSRGVR